jgi:hypothetical protein
MSAQDPDKPLPSGWLPPRAPAHHVSDVAPPRAQGTWPRDPARPVEPSTPAAVFAIAIGAASILLLALSAGVAFFVCLILSSGGLMIGSRLRAAIRAGRPGRESQARAAVVVAWIGLALAIVAGITWIVLSANGVSPQDLQDALEREVERRRNRG